MREFQYTIQDPLGIHARPAGQLAKLVKDYPDTTATLTRGEQTVKLSQLMKLMGMAVKHGDEVKITASGPQEEEASAALQQFFQEHL